MPRGRERSGPTRWSCSPESRGGPKSAPFRRGLRWGHALRRLVAQGGLTTGLFNALVAMVLPGPGSVFLHQEWDYPAPVFVGDTVTAVAEVVEARVDKPLTRLRCVAPRQDGIEVLRGECLVCTLQPER